MTAQDLKNSILQLAMQGKLVPQMSTDEPVSELLKRITQQKIQLVEDGVIKKEKPLPAISDEDIPFDIPTSWLWVRLGYYCLDAFCGKSPVYSKTPTPYEVIGQAANQQAGLDYSQVKYTVSEFWDSMSSKYFLQENDVLLNTLGHGTLGRSGIVPALQKKLLTDGHLFVFRLCSATASKYFYYYLQYKRPEIEKSANGSTNQTFLSLKRTNQWLIPVPPLAEQERIVAKIEELLPFVSEYDAAEKRLSALNAEFPDKLRKSILQQAAQGKLTERDPSDEPASELLKRIQTEKTKLIADGKIKREKPLPLITEEDCPFEIPDEWEWVRLTDVGEVSRGRSKHRPRNDAILYRDGKYPLVQTGDVARSGGQITSCSSFYNDVGLAQSRMWPKGTLCLTIAANIADVGILDFDACFPDSVVGFNAFSPMTSNKYFLYMLMAYKAILDSMATRSAQKNINLDTIASLAYPLPPLAEQQRIVERVEELLAACNRLKPMN